MRVNVVAGLLVIAVIVAGCDALAGPSDRTAPGSGPMASPMPAASPTPPAASGLPLATASPVAASSPPPTPSASLAVAPVSLPRAAMMEKDGVRVRMELQRNPLRAGEPSWVRTTVRNLGTDDVTWFHDGCAISVGVHGTSLVDWPPGIDQTGQALSFKNRLLNVYVTTDRPRPAGLNFVPKSMLAAGSYGCADIGISETIPPGKVIRRTLWWSGYADVRRGLPPTGSAIITGSAGFYWRGHKEPDRIIDHRMELELDAWIIEGLQGDRLTPPEVIDAALADPSFVAYLETQDLGNGREEILWYDPGADVWEVGVMPWYETKPPRIHGVLVDPVTGAIRGPLDRPWNEEADGYP